MTAGTVGQRLYPHNSIQKLFHTVNGHKQNTVLQLYVSYNLIKGHV